MRVACSNAVAAKVPFARITSGARATNSSAYFRLSATSPSDHRVSMRTLRPSVQPNCWSACANARSAGLRFRIVRERHEHADAPHAFGLLRPRRQRPADRRAAKQRDEIAPFHCPMPPVLPTERIAHLSYGRRLPRCGISTGLCRLWVEMRRTRIEHILSALPPLATEERTFGIGSSVPIATFRAAARSIAIRSPRRRSAINDGAMVIESLRRLQDLNWQKSISGDQCGDCDSNFMSVISRRCTKLGLMHKKPDAASFKK
jgi:hypothetical protein